MAPNLEGGNECEYGVFMDKLSVLSDEFTHAREALSRAMGTIYTLYGVIVPMIFGALAVFGDDALGREQIDVLGFIVILVASGALSYANSLWMEAHQYLRYMYLELVPRMYQYADMQSERNFFQHIALTREPYTWRPVFVFHVLLIVGVVVLGLGAIASGLQANKFRAVSLFVLAIITVGSAVYTSILTQRSASGLLGDLKRSVKSR